MSQESGKDFLREIFPDLVEDEEIGDVNLLTEVYQRYKRDFVKQIAFAPEEESLGGTKL